MPNTHCKPTGSLGTGELPIPPVPGIGTIQTPGALGNNLIRGLVVFCHGLNDPNAVAFNFLDGSFLTSLVADGWITYNAQFQEDNYDGLGSTGVFNDINNDASNGARYVDRWFRTWDHIMAWKAKTYSPRLPVVAVGFSWGAWHVLHTAISRTSDMIAYVAHCPIQFLTDANPSNTAGTNWGTLTSTGADLSNTCLNGVSIPGIVGWSNPDTIASSYKIKTPCDAAIAASQPLTEYPTTAGHLWNAAASTEFLNYFTNTIDPLAPKAF